MSAAFSRAVKTIDALSAREKALMAHCLIAALDEQEDEATEDDWLKLADSRQAEMASGAVSGVSWATIKARVQQKNTKFPTKINPFRNG